MTRLLLCTDLDRTLIPNGTQPESSRAKERFHRLVNRKEITLAFVTGRHLSLIKQAIAEFDLPRPDFAIADVGSTIYQVDSFGWQRWSEWDAQIAPDWRGLTHDDLHRLLRVEPVLRLQEPERQNRHKLSYYVPLEVDVQALIGQMNAQLIEAGIKANVIWSIDEVTALGLVDILPESANKLRAIRFLMQRQGFLLRDTVFAGDSGNDLDVLRSEISSVLVANADAEVRTRAVSANSDALYLAKGSYLGMNGNYSAGILEGAAHFWPEVDTWLREQD
ncbi:MAG: HAD-IIB family hydrolase [Pirellulaceae bacterium]